MEINMGRISTWAGGLVSVAVLVGIPLTGYSKLMAMELATAEAMAVATTAAVEVEQNRKKIDMVMVLLTQQAAQVDNIYKRGLIVQGKALVLDVGDKPYVELNARDSNGPTRLADFEKLHITNLTHPDMLNGDVRIGPSFSNTTPGYVMNISKAAGVLLHAKPGTWIEVRAKPHFDEVGKDD